MSWTKLNESINANSLMALDANTCRDYGVKLGLNFPFHKVKFTCQALAMLAQLNDYDQQLVVKDIEQICAHPNAKHSIKHSINPLHRLWRTKYPFQNYHYLITYILQDNKINIEDILFDKQLQGVKGTSSAERTMLYEVKRVGSATYNKAKKKDEIDELTEAWSNAPQATTQVNTVHAAVNGMKNDLTKAAWLMGTHVDVAYPGGIKAYTLFHNPSDNFALDAVECGFDNRQNQTSHNAQHLAAVLAQNSQQGKKVKWVAHSQGAIIFCSALEQYRIKYGKPLTTQELAIHGSGANLDRLKSAASNAGMTIVNIRNNPYDFVPNLMGHNDTSGSSLARSMSFMKIAIRGSVGGSPHTLPFLGLKTYATQLQLSGDKNKATKVRKFIKTLPKGDSRL
ncbi:hypothetical protein [Colwellia sp. 20A7]|uniref:hypothetical protein n=1 Tax=Colwellia sp. 20A7 TaxID=2689569 RepID=UPI00135A1C7F|nr:hypothetical protein [Colwellia sp. 20A7]